MDQSGILYGIKDLIHAVLHRQDEAGGKLSQRTSGIHQSGGVWQEAQVGH